MRGYDIRAQDGAVSVYIYGDIGYDVTASRFVEDFQRLGDVGELALRINSYGGDAFDGIAIYNALVGSKARITTYIDGIAASIASYIALAGERILVAPNAMIMIHEPWAATAGNAAEHAKTAELLENMASILAEGYAKRLKMDVAAVRDLMRAETWWTAEEAVRIRYADDIIGKDAQNSLRGRLAVAAARKRFDLIKLKEEK